MKFSSFRPVTLIAGYAFVAGAVFGITGTGIGAAMLGSAVFDDVKSGSYYDAAIGELYGDGVIKGYEGTDNFGPDDYVTRGQVAVMLERFKDEINGGTDDNDSSSSRSRSTGSSSSRSSSSSSSNIYNPKGTMRFTTSAFSISESKSNVTITVVRVGGNLGEVAVEYAATAGTATAGSDFDAVSGTLTFANKETSKTFDITLKDDTSSEGDETITLTLSSPKNGVSMGVPATAILTIKDNEAFSSSSSSSSNATSGNGNGTLSFSATTYMANENAGSITITVERTGGSSGAVGVNYATSNGSGQSNIDYTSTSGTLSFGAGETSKTFTVAVLDDSSLFGNTTFNLTLSSVSGGASIGTSSAVVTIHDNENTNSTFGSGSIKLAKSSYAVTESDGEVLITVQRVGGAQGTVTVNYSTVNGSAFSGSDYTSTSGTLTFLQGETSKVVAVPVLKDSAAESEDEFYFNLSSPSSNSTLLNPNSATVSISS